MRLDGLIFVVVLFGGMALILGLVQWFWIIRPSRRVNRKYKLTPVGITCFAFFYLLAVAAVMAVWFAP